MKFHKTNLAAYLNFLRAKHEMITGEVTVKSFPYIMFIDPTSICQLNCPSCPTGVENEGRRNGQQISFRERVNMPSDMFSSILDELGEYLFMIMLYNWGEPLLHKSLPAFIRRAKLQDIAIEIHTNLSLPLNDAYLEDLLLSDVDVIAASIDGFSQQSYGTYRKGGDFELTKKNISRLAAMRNRLGLQTEIDWNFLVFSFNEHEIGATEKFCQDNDIKFRRREAFIANPDWLPSYRQEAEPQKNQSPFELDSNRSPEITPCAWHYCHSVINANGSISPCCAPWQQEHDLGQLKLGAVNFSDIWNNDSYRKSRGALAHKPVDGLEKVSTLCLSCPYDKHIQNLYSDLDVKVFEQMQQVFSGKN